MAVHRIGQELGEGLQIGQVLGEGEAASEGGAVGSLVEQKNQNETEAAVAAGPTGLENYVLRPEFLRRWQYYPPTDHIWVKNSAQCIWGQYRAAWGG